MSTRPLIVGTVGFTETVSQDAVERLVAARVVEQFGDSDSYDYYRPTAITDEQLRSRGFAMPATT